MTYVSAEFAHGHANGFFPGSIDLDALSTASSGAMPLRGDLALLACIDDMAARAYGLGHAELGDAMKKAYAIGARPRRC